LALVRQTKTQAWPSASRPGNDPDRKVASWKSGYRNLATSSRESAGPWWRPAPTGRGRCPAFHTVDESWTGGNADMAMKMFDADRVHEPDSGRRNATNFGRTRAQPSRHMDAAAMKRPALIDRVRRRLPSTCKPASRLRADHDKQANERHVVTSAEAVSDTQPFPWPPLCPRAAPR